MWRLFNNQFLFFWHIIRTRFLFWLIFISLIILSTRIAGNPHLTVFSLFFDGVSYATVETHRVTLPILWFAYFFVPLLILLNSFQQLWRTRTLHLRGLQISPRRFSKVNLLLIALVTTVYDVLLIIVMLITAMT
ncbi:MAG: rhodopsin, partial [Lacticaseibacillus paracasei]